MQPSRPKIGVVTVTYNSEQVLPEFLRSLWPQTYENFVLYAVDNESKDESVAMLRAEADTRLRVIANEQNVGVAEGNNQGVRAALADGCEAVLLLNNDVAFEAGFLSQLADALSTSGCAMVAPKTKYWEPGADIWWAGGYFQKLLGWRTTHRGYRERDCGQYDRPAIVSYAPTCCVLIRSAVFDAIGYFDSKYFVYYDDTDFMFRAYRSGCRLLYVPEPILRHKVSSLTGPESPFSIRQMTRNRIYFWYKHFGVIPALAGSAALAAIYCGRALFGMARRETLSIQLAALWEGLWMHTQLRRESAAA